MEFPKITQEDIESLWKDFLISVVRLKYQKACERKTDFLYKTDYIFCYPLVYEIEKATQHEELEKLLFQYFSE